jgi:hypothetical protein
MFAKPDSGRVAYSATKSKRNISEGRDILTNDVWHIVINVDLEPYEDIIATIKEELTNVEEQKREFTSVTELKQIEILLMTLESRLQSFKQILPRLDRRRSLLNLETLFGTATISDVNSLHNVLNELQLNQKDIVHSMSNQVTYIKTLDIMTITNVQAITKLSNIVKDVVVESHDRFKQVTRDILWLNITLYNQSELYMVNRQLEFALLQMTQQLSELVNAFQYTLLGKLPLNILNPNNLHNILKNVSLHLPEGYELAAGT